MLASCLKRKLLQQEDSINIYVIIFDSKWSSLFQ